MSVESTPKTTENLFGFPQIKGGLETNSALIFEEITTELEEYLLKESDDSDSTDGVFKFLTTICDHVQGEFKELLDGSSNKKRFPRALSQIFVLLLSTKVGTAEKIKKNTQNCRGNNR